MDDATFDCENCGACCFEDEGNGSICDPCLEGECCDICGEELLSVREEMTGLCDSCNGGPQ